MSSAADNELDPVGCLVFALRFAGCSMLLYILMFVAIIVAGLVLTLFA